MIPNCELQLAFMQNNTIVSGKLMNADIIVVAFLLCFHDYLADACGLLYMSIVGLFSCFVLANPYICSHDGLGIPTAGKPYSVAFCTKWTDYLVVNGVVVIFELIRILVGQILRIAAMAGYPSLAWFCLERFFAFSNVVRVYDSHYAVVIVWSEPLFMQKNTIVCLKLRNADVSGNRQTNCVKWIQHEKEDMRVGFNPLTKASVFEANDIRTSDQRCICYVVGFLLGIRNDTKSVPGVLVFLRLFRYNLVCRWWDVGWTSLGSYSERLSWFNAIRLGSKVKCLFEGVLYVTWWCLWNFRNQSIFSVQKPRRAVTFDDIVTRSFLGVSLDVIVLLVGIVGVSILFCFLNAENEMGINIDSPIPFSSTNKHENALPFHFLLSIPPLALEMNFEIFIDPTLTLENKDTPEA
nr:RNA-directed DNA polymerase, eukaryota [Tanacetum cinerariifolium]